MPARPVRRRSRRTRSSPPWPPPARPWAPHHRGSTPARLRVATALRHEHDRCFIFIVCLIRGGTHTETRMILPPYACMRRFREHVEVLDSVVFMLGGFVLYADATGDRSKVRDDVKSLSSLPSAPSEVSGKRQAVSHACRGDGRSFTPCAYDTLPPFSSSRVAASLLYEGHQWLRCVMCTACARRCRGALVVLACAR
jgi:hypothetical protein